MSISSLLTKLETGKDFKVLSNNFFDAITGIVGSDTLNKFNFDVNSFITEYLRIYDYILKNGFIDISKQNFSKEILAEVKKGFTNPEYEGVNKTMVENIKSFKEKNPDGDIKGYIRSLNDRKIEQVSGDLTQRLGSVVAKESGKTVVFGITRQDERVRQKHSRHNNKWWFLDSGYEPWYDARCRCTYIYEEDTELVDSLGISQLRA